MIRINLILLGLLVFMCSFSQSSKLLKTEKVKKTTWNYYAENDNSILINILNKSDDTIEIRRYSDINLTTEIGEWTEYFPKMKIKAKRFFNDGFPIGIWIQYTKESEIISQKDYNFELFYNENDTTITNKIKSNLEQSVDNKNEKMPEFKGGTDALMKFIYNEKSPIDYYTYTKYEKTGRNNILVKFAIDIDGTVINVRAINKGKKILEKDAVRVIKKMPKWIPGYNANNNPCKVEITIPIIYFFSE